MRRRLRVTYGTSWARPCGVADYSAHLTPELRRHCNLDVLPYPRPRAATVEWTHFAEDLRDADVVHLQHAYPFFGGMHPVEDRWPSLLQSLRAPTVVTIHEFDDQPRLGPASGVPAVWYKRWFNRRAFCPRSISHRITHSPLIANQLRELGVPASTISVLPMPAPSVDPRSPTHEECRRELGLGGRPLLVIIGFLARRKGYDVALAALRELPAEYLLVAAGGEHSDDRTGTEAWLKAEARRMGLSERFRITGYQSVEDLDRICRAADLVLAPFESMSASASLAFAQARARPIIGSNLPELMRLPGVEHFPVGDSGALARGILRLMADDPRRCGLAEAGLAHARESSYEGFATAIVAIYERLAA